MGNREGRGNIEGRGNREGREIGKLWGKGNVRKIQKIGK